MDEQQLNQASKDAATPATPATASALITEALNDKDGKASPATPAEKSPDPSPATPAATEKKADAPPASVADLIKEAVKPLQEELAKLKASPTALEEQRRNYDAREDFITQVNSDDRYPRAMLRNILPASQDKNALWQGMQVAGDWVKHIVDGAMKQYGWKLPNVGGVAGGDPPTGEKFLPAAPTPTPVNISPTSLIEAGLKERRSPRGGLDED